MSSLLQTIKGGEIKPHLKTALFLTITLTIVVITLEIYVPEVFRACSLMRGFCKPTPPPKSERLLADTPGRIPRPIFDLSPDRGF